MDTVKSVPKLWSHRGEISTADVVGKSKHVLLYFSASWCPPCRQFTPVLSRFYTQHKDSKAFEIIFCSWDQTDKEFGDYYAKMPWLAMPQSSVNTLTRRFGINSIPALVVLDTETGEVVQRDGRMGVVTDPNAEAFPWKGQQFANPMSGLLRLIAAGALVISGLVLYAFRR